MKDLGKKGAFYLGRTINPATGKTGSDLLFDSKDLTTHAVCVGMTGSGKTGMGITILEEAGLNKIPAIVIDPKGDLSNLLLTFPDLTPEEFSPWIDQAEAERKGIDNAAYSKQVASMWKEGLAKWNENGERIKKFRDSVDLTIYTPASEAGIPISILNSFTAPPKEERLDSAQLRDRVLSICSSLLALLGITADPIKSREHILISNILMHAWQNGQDLNIASLIQQIQRPPFVKIGALDVDTFYPPKERMELSISLNNLLASPGFQIWMEGEPLNIKNLLYTEKGKPKISIISIAHLSDSERMFFVTLLLNEFISWMRHQEGSSSLRTVLYMDEIFGFFPPTAAPPSKLPMLTLLKQARAFGIGIVLVTQNPVDLDYKGLSNCGTWFIGKLQTERDKTRVLEGLRIASNGDIDTNTLDKMIALTGNRIFIMRSVHQKDPVVFETRWTLSYLRGPLTLSQIALLMHKSEVPVASKTTTPSAITQQSAATSSIKPMAPIGIEEYFINAKSGHSPVRYEPKVMAIGRLHFVDTKNKVDLWKEICFALPAENEGKAVDWENGVNLENLKNQLQKNPAPQSYFEELPSGLMQEKTYRGLEKTFAESLYQHQRLSLFLAPQINMISKAEESKEDFQARAFEAFKEKHEDQIKKIQNKYSEKIDALKARIQRIQEKANNRTHKAWMQKIQAFISFCTTLLSAFFGQRRITKKTISETGTTFRRASRITEDDRLASDAQEELKNSQQQLQDLEDEMNREIFPSSLNSGEINIETLSIHPRKSDISVEKIALIWWAQ